MLSDFQNSKLLLDSTVYRGKNHVKPQRYRYLFLPKKPEITFPLVTPLQVANDHFRRCLSVNVLPKRFEVSFAFQ